MKPHPTPPVTQLAMCLYQLAHGCTFLTVRDLFGLAAPTAYCIFQDVFKALVKNLHERFVFLPRTSKEWSQELQGFLENWEFPCVGAWDNFHMYVSTTLKISTVTERDTMYLIKASMDITRDFCGLLMMSSGSW